MTSAVRVVRIRDGALGWMQGGRIHTDIEPTIELVAHWEHERYFTANGYWRLITDAGDGAEVVP